MENRRALPKCLSPKIGEENVDKQPTLKEEEMNQSCPYPNLFRAPESLSSW